MSDKPNNNDGWKRGSLVVLKQTGERGRVIRCSIPGSSKHRYDIILSDTLKPGHPVRTIDASQDELELITG